MRWQMINIGFGGISIVIVCFLMSSTYAIENVTKTETNEGKLLFAHVIFRHGDRTPIEPYPNDPWKDISNWPVDWGQLTNVGKQQHYALGKWLKNRYESLLNVEYSPKLIYVQSTDVDRSLMSALSNIAGLFPPQPDQIWSPELIKWQPIPVHTTAESFDYILAAKRRCPAYDFALKKYKHSDEYRQLDKQLKPLYDYLSMMSGKKVDSVQAVQNLVSTLYIERINNKTLPDWTKSVYYPGSEMEWAAARSFSTHTNTPQLARLKTGFLLKDILQRFRNKTESKLVPNRSMWIYSAHDTTVASILNTLGVFELHSPPFAACVMLELRIENTVPVVQVFYKNTTAEPQQMYLPNCGLSCPLDRMFELYSFALPGNFEDECRLSMLSMTYAEVEIVSFTVPIITGVGLLVAAALIFLALHLYQQRIQNPDAKWYMRIDS